jgi:hypothetical protein
VENQGYFNGYHRLASRCQKILGAKNSTQPCIGCISISFIAAVQASILKHSQAFSGVAVAESSAHEWKALLRANHIKVPRHA